ncbi:MAG TPA: hypothetical protein VGG45_00180 [Terracidiphilus sp.]|jgi:hypothetical protein
MSSNPRDQKTSAEETLRLVASLPAPEGLEHRIHNALDRAPRRGSVLSWPRSLRPESSWMRSAAAAAIVFVVAGGGWGVYLRVAQNQPGKVIVMPARIPGSGGFGSAGAVRIPETLPGPKAPQAVKPQPKAAKKAAHSPAGAGQPAAKDAVAH